MTRPWRVTISRPRAETIARDRTAGTPIEIAVTPAGNTRRLPPSLEDAAFRIGREAIVNVVRHADASRIEIHLDFRTNTFYLEVRDNGRGVSPNEMEQARKQGHFGLSGIESRASNLGGHCEVRPRPGAGTHCCSRVAARPVIVRDHTSMEGCRPMRCRA